MIIGIYKITNPKGKIYIGQSTNIDKRLRWYKKIHCKEQPKLYYSLIKYGVENHQFEIIEQCSVEQLNEREIYWGQFYNVLDPEIGLNLKELGLNGQHTKKTKQKLREANLGRIHSKKTRKKISNALKGRIVSPEVRKRMSEAKQNLSNEAKKIRNKKIGLANKGKIRSEETKLKMRKPRSKEFCERISKERMGKSLYKNRKQVFQYDLQGNFIKEWNGIVEAAHQLNLNKTGINNNLLGISKTSNGYIWKYKNNTEYEKIRTKTIN